MRDIASCFGEYAVSVADSASCVSSSTQPSLSSPVQEASTSLYNIILSTQKKLMITVTWCKTQSSRGLSISFDNNSSLPIFKLNISSMFKRLKGVKVLESKNIKVEVLWDVCVAKYKNGPEPVNGYYVLIMIDSEIGLTLGDMGNDEINKRIKKGVFKGKSSLVSRREQCNGSSVYSTRARFCDPGALHDISIRCVGESHHKTSHQPSLSVWIDKRIVVQVKRLQWNFRGNQSIFVDGLEIDLLWDVHDWLFNTSSSGYAVFAFRIKNGIQNANWSDSDHKLSLKHQDNKPADFTLLIHACKTSYSSGKRSQT